MKIGLCGAHRVGKTSLINDLSKKLNIKKLNMQTYEIFKREGINPNDFIDFNKRLKIQQILLEEYKLEYSKHEDFISDRTPLDLIAYTFADINNKVDVNNQNKIDNYLNNCLTETLKVFDHLFLIQPGIKVIQEEKGKAKMIRSFQDHLNLIIIGYIIDKNIPCKVIPKEMINFDDRLNFITSNLT